MSSILDAPSSGTEFHPNFECRYRRLQILTYSARLVCGRWVEFVKIYTRLDRGRQAWRLKIETPDVFFIYGRRIRRLKIETPNVFLFADVEIDVSKLRRPMFSDLWTSRRLRIAGLHTYIQTYIHTIQTDGTKIWYRYWSLRVESRIKSEASFFIS